MDISKASNFERYVFDLVMRNPERMQELWGALEKRGEFSIAGAPEYARIEKTGIIAGSSSHADRLATIRVVSETYGTIIDPHTADGVTTGLRNREAGVPLICLETALPAKFGETIREALARDPDYPPSFKDLLQLPEKFETFDADAAALKKFAAAHAD
jgi:threonine synthase